MKTWALRSVALSLCVSAMVLSGFATATPKSQPPEKPVRYVQLDPILGKQPHKQKYELRDGKLCPVDMFGSREYHKSCLMLAPK